MKHEIVVFRFDDALSEEEERQVETEFRELIGEIKDAMAKAEDRTTNQLRNDVLRNVRENISRFIRLERKSRREYRILLESETLRAFDVSLPINGVQTTAKQIAERIGKEFAWDISRQVSFKSERMA